MSGNKTEFTIFTTEGITSVVTPAPGKLTALISNRTSQ
jgi:hypothetical protein